MFAELGSGQPPLFMGTNMQIKNGIRSSDAESSFIMESIQRTPGRENFINFIKHSESFSCSHHVA